ncbi:restriction endonuclease subunit S [Nitrosomonas communis]|uniref:restriction endonuclease subunit S n=1 Tax=Nitrosomonas communis TaxID=44574 RepID=UPI0026E993B5|nr:restriction endonuclease subunit S [Nitrosomonas communis]MCO6426789.1 restriction endonuclease subunit S [Nitrosomonas communis]
MSNWTKCTLGEISDSCLGKMLDQEKNKGSFQPYLANLNVRWGDFSLENLQKMRFEDNEQDRYGLVYGDLVICEGGEPGRCAVWRNQMPNMKIQKALHRLRVKPGFSADFLYYRMLLAGRTGELSKYFIGSTIKHLTGIGLKQVEFKFPNESEQIKIASVLRAIDTKIELNNRINAELEAMAKCLYDYWFVQFDFPFDFAQGKPDANGKPYKTSGGKMVYNPTLKREIPEGWEVCSLWNIAKYFNGLAMQKYRPTGEEYLPVIKIREMNEGFSESTEKARTDLPIEAIVNDGDVLFSWSATLDVKIWSQGRGALNQHIFKVTSDKYPKTFYYFELLNYLKHFKMMAELRKTTMGHITLDHLKQAKICLPQLDLLKQADQFIDPIFNKHLMLEKENRTLNALRDWLLPMLMNGQVTVQSATE